MARQRGQGQTDATKKKISRALKGIAKSPEHRDAISEGQRQRHARRKAEKEAEEKKKGG